MQSLPVSQVIPDIKSCLQDHNRLILQAPPGAGKTTLVPLALLDQPWLENKQIIMLEPRRLATRNAAARMAELLGEKVGETVGYQIRQDKQYSDKTRILVVTEGILTRKLQNDPVLEGIALVIFDEFHERNLHGDLSLAFCLQSQALLNEQLKIMLMSATLNTSALSELLSTAENSPSETNALETNALETSVPTISSEGRSYPVDIIYRPDNSPKIDPWNLTQATCLQALNALREHSGNILIFLPGVKEIKQLEHELQSHLNELNNSQTIIAPLYGDLSKTQQDQAIAPPPKDKNKIVLATNIAETSLTIEGITVVIDSGLQREARFNPGSGMNGLHTIMIAQDSADQRSGRAGRLSAGICYRLWTQAQQKQLAPHQRAEIMRSDLAPMMLELAQWGIQDINDLQWLDTPPPGHIAQAKELLQTLQAIDDKGLITPHGKNILKLGVHPRLAHMLLKACEIDSSQWLDTACQLAALLTEKDILNRDAPCTSDITHRLSLLEQVKKKDTLNNAPINKHQCQRVLKIAKEFFVRLKNIVSQKSFAQTNESSTDIAGILLAFAYPDRIAQLRSNKEQRYLLSNGKGACFIDQDNLGHEPYLAIANLSEQGHTIQKKEARIFLAAPITEQQIEAHFSPLIQTSQSTRWDQKKQKVECLTRTKLGCIVLNEQQSLADNSDEIQAVLMQGIRASGLSCLPWTKSAIQLKQRLHFIWHMQQHNPDLAATAHHIDLPDMSDKGLLAKLEHWLLPHLSNENSIKQLQNLNMETILSSLLSWDTLQMINELAPEKIRVPSGSEIRIDYSDPDSPILAVRLQELFGLQTTPAILNGRYPLLLHLLSPAFRPMQVTQDLASFWENTYNEVKKELRGKYKKHYWPDDPLQAQATSRAKPRKT